MTSVMRPFLISGLLLILIVICAGCTQDPANLPSQTPVSTASVTTMEPVSPTGTKAAPDVATREEMVAFVKEAVDYARAKR